MSKSKQRLVAEFAECVLAQNREARKGESVSIGNRYAKRYAKAFEHLCQYYGDAGRDALADLLTFPVSEVRVMAAAFLLRYRNKEALAVLRDVATNERGSVAIGAAQAIKRWEEGTWQLDPAPSVEVTELTNDDAMK